MAKEPQTPFEMPADVRDMAERSLEQARKAFDQVMQAAKSNLAVADEHGKAIHAGAREIGATVASIAEKNAASAFDYVQQLMKAQDPQTLMQLQVDFLRTQMQGLSEQAKTLTDTVSKAAADATRKNNQ